MHKNLKHITHFSGGVREKKESFICSSHYISGTRPTVLLSSLFPFISFEVVTDSPFEL